MTAFQEFVEMPITSREESFPRRTSPPRSYRSSRRNEQERRRLNWATHFALGAMWGSAFTIAERAGLRGQKAVAAVFAVVYTGDVLLSGLYEPSSWSKGELAVDLMDKLVQAEASCERD